MIEITVTPDDLGTIYDAGSILVMTGTAEGGTRVRFSGDTRPMADMLDAVIGSGDEATVMVESWQISSVPPEDEDEEQGP